MSVIYRGKIPCRNYTVGDFYDNGVVVSWWSRWKDYQNFSCCRIIFRSNGLLAEIRSINWKNKITWAIDTKWGWRTNEQTCLTTECKNLKEAKSILFEWFKDRGFSIAKDITDRDWSKNTLSYQNIQLKLFNKLR